MDISGTPINTSDVTKDDNGNMKDEIKYKKLDLPVGQPIGKPKAVIVRTTPESIANEKQIEEEEQMDMLDIIKINLCNKELQENSLFAFWQYVTMCKTLGLDFFLFKQCMFTKEVVDIFFDGDPIATSRFLAIIEKYYNESNFAKYPTDDEDDILLPPIELLSSEADCLLYFLQIIYYVETKIYLGSIVEEPIADLPAVNTEQLYNYIRQFPHDMPKADKNTIPIVLCEAFYTKPDKEDNKEEGESETDETNKVARFDAGFRLSVGVVHRITFWNSSKMQEWTSTEYNTCVAQGVRYINLNKGKVISTSLINEIQMKLTVAEEEEELVEPSHEKVNEDELEVVDPDLL